MRGTWADDANQMTADIGPLGCSVSAGHGHADLLSIQCAIFGEPCLVDAGNYCYTPESEWRNFFRATAAHSTVVVDGQSQSEPAGPFGWLRRPEVHLREWQTGPELDFLDAEHDAFSRRGDPIVHRRRILFVKPRYWLVVDDVAGALTHQIELTFQFAPMQVALGPNRWARAQTPNGKVLWVGPFTSASLSASLQTGERRPIRGWVAPNYGEREPAPALIYSAAVALPWRVMTLLFPDAEGLSAPPAVRPIYGTDHLPAGLLFERSRESVRIDDRQTIVSARQSTPCVELPAS
jgi:hypothetical protein